MMRNQFSFQLSAFSFQLSAFKLWLLTLLIPVVLVFTVLIYFSGITYATRCAPDVCTSDNAGPYRYLCGTQGEFDCSFELEMNYCTTVKCENGTSMEMPYDCRIWPWCHIRMVKTINTSAYEVTTIWGKAILNDPEDCDVDQCFFGDDCTYGGAPECAYENTQCPD
jgi:hypothetical protein